MSGKKIRLDKYLVHVGYGTRSTVQKVIRGKKVKVDGQVIIKPETAVNPITSIVEVNGERMDYQEFYHFILNKPRGYITATEDGRDQTVLDLLGERDQNKEVFPVGRLDKDTEGLLVLTNDGQLAHRVLSPKKHVPKTYYAKIEGRVTEEDIKAFEAGVTLDDGYKTMPAQLKILESGEQSEIELTIHEGKFHQVKRMFESVGKKVVYLKRLSMGKLMLDEKLGLGEYRELTDEEVKLIEER